MIKERTLITSMQNDMRVFKKDYMKKTKKQSLLNEVILQNILVIFQISTPDQGAQEHGNSEGQSVEIKTNMLLPEKSLRLTC